MKTRNKLSQYSSEFMMHVRLRGTIDGDELRTNVYDNECLEAIHMCKEANWSR